eukprot:9859779-Heterocapsa_arctica.AAC.1
MKITVQTAGGSFCEVFPCDRWTCHDLNMEIQQKLDVPVSQQRFIHRCKVLKEFMGTAAIITMGQLLRMEARPEMSLELLLYIRSPAVVEVLEAVKQNGMALQDVSEELRHDREV